MKSKSLSIGILCITALILFIAQFIPVRPVSAGEVIKDRDFSLVTSRSNQGGDVVYVIDNRSGQMAVFAWDAGRRALQLRGTGAVSDAFR